MSKVPLYMGIGVSAVTGIDKMTNATKQSY